jgi:sialidase-1
LLHTLVHLNLGVFVFGSSDHGKSWFILDKPLQPADESKIIELADGRWMVNSRVNNKGYRYVHLSDNKGNTWVTYADTALHDPGCNASIVRHTIPNGYKSDMLFFVNIHNQKLRKNLAISVSSDEGITWTQPKTIYSGNAAYNDACVLPTGELGVLFEKDDYVDISFVRLSIEWILETNKAKD